MYFSPLVLGFAALTSALAVVPKAPNPYEGLVPRQFTRTDGSTATIWENPMLKFVRGTHPPEAATELAKRLTYTTYENPIDGRNDYCGEAAPVYTNNPTDALASDCRLISEAYTIPGGNAPLGYWYATPSDWTVFTPGDWSSWLTLAAIGTCKFPIRVLGTPPNVWFGANDLRFYIRADLQHVVNNRLGSLGTVGCYNNTPGQTVTVQFSLQHT